MKQPRLFAVLPALAFVMLALSSCGSTPAAAKNADKVARAIVLRHAKPCHIMQQLGIVETDSADAQRIYSSDTPRRASVTSLGVDLVVPFNDDSVLIVYGEKSAVASLAAVIAKLDVAPRMVQVRAELYTVDAGLSEKIGIDWSVGSATNKDGTQVSIFSDAVLKGLRRAAAPLVTAPVIRTYNAMSATISISGGQQTAQLTVMPRANRDKTISLSIKWMAHTSATSTQALDINRIVRDGQSAIVGGWGNPDGGGRILVVTAALIVTPK